jgi:hypothetical protein
MRPSGVNARAVGAATDPTTVSVKPLGGPSAERAALATGCEDSPGSDDAIEPCVGTVHSRQSARATKRDEDTRHLQPIDAGVDRNA